MDIIDPILSVASQIYALVEQVKANKKQCNRVCDRVRALESVLNAIRKRIKGQSSANVEKTLNELSITLESAKELIGKFISSSCVKRVLNSGNHQDAFQSLNDRLDDAFQALVLNQGLDLEDKVVKVFDQIARDKEDKMDRKEDNAELERLLREYHKEMEEKLEAMQKEYESIGVKMGKVLAILEKKSIPEVDIRMIKPDELSFDFPKVPFIKTETSEVYKGMYCNFPVAIKRYTETLHISTSNVEKIFNKEVETMKRFESPNILRMFGISVAKEGTKPQFLVIMEYCEMGNLRQVLDNEKRELSWTTKAHMCRDAARGLYRLHQSEEQSRVHGSINSSKFLVSEGYIVKLGGFELAKTETSLRKTTKEKASGSLAYSSPQMLLDINHKYSKECEIYSFGIVLWEIATRSIPYKGWSDMDILDKVGKQEYRQPLPDDCPELLGAVINACLAQDCFHRPSAGVLVDKLQTALGKIEN